MSKQLRTDEDVSAACENVRSSGSTVTVRNVYALVGGSWPRIARLVAAFNKAHDALALMTDAHDKAISSSPEVR